MKLLILSPYPEGYACTRLLEVAQKRSHQATIINPDELYLLVSQANGHDRAYHKGNRIYLGDYDAVICRIGSGVDYGAFCVEHLNENMGLFSTAKASGIRTASNKMLTIQKLSQHKIRVPKTIFVKEPDNYEDLISLVGGLPFVAKTVTGSQGTGVIIFNDALSAKTALQSFYKLGTKLILQEYLEAEGKDIRAFVVGNEVIGAMERTAGKGDFRANISQGGTGSKIELSEEEKTMAVKVANLLNLGICGVDLVRNKKDNKTYCIEANSNPNTEGFEKYTGIDATTKIIEYVEQSVAPQTKNNSSNSNANQFPVLSKILAENKLAVKYSWDIEAEKKLGIKSDNDKVYVSESQVRLMLKLGLMTHAQAEAIGYYD